jgi:hypothetical protein
MIEIALDDISTWPAKFLAHFKKYEPLLLAYERCDRDLTNDGIWGPDYVATALRPENPFWRLREEFLTPLSAEYSDKLALRGFHCTRLTDDEVATIRAGGLTPPNASRLEQRIRAIERAGLITDRIARRLIRENYAAESTRADRIWFVFTRPPLKRQGGVESLFRYWGGEALYARHDRDPETGPVLASIGSPRIIEACVPIPDMGPYFPGRQFVQQFLASLGVSVFDADYEHRTRSQVPSTRIRRVISRSDAAFDVLTGCAGWTSPL